MYEGPAGSADKGIPLTLPPGAEKVGSTSSFDIYRSVQQQEIILYPTDYHAHQLRIGAADLEKLVTESSLSGMFQESTEEIPEQAQLYDKTVNWEVYAAAERIIIKPQAYHSGQLVLSFDDVRILRGLTQPR